MNISPKELLEYSQAIQLQLIWRILDLENKHVIIDHNNKMLKINGDTFLENIRQIRKEIEGY